MRIGLISDIHEDILSLENALRILSNEKCDKIFCLGDIVGFALPFYQYIESRDAERCVNLVRENCEVAVIGNHDLYAIKKIPEHNAGFDYDNDWYSLDYEVRSKKSKNKIWLYEDNEIKASLSDSAIDFLIKLKEVEIFNCNDFTLMFSHFCFPDFTGSAIFFPSEPFHLEKHFQYMKSNNCKISFSGHGHTEGNIYVNEDQFKSNKFGQFTLIDELQWIVIPCIARTSRHNGVALFDTDSMLLKTIPLSLNN